MQLIEIQYLTHCSTPLTLYTH